VDVEHQPAVRPQPIRDRGERGRQLAWLEIGDPVERADDGVEPAVDPEIGERVPDQLDARPDQASGTGEHLLRRVDADDPVAAPHQFGGEQARAAGDVEDVEDVVDVAGPELVEKGCDRVVAGVDDDLVVDPRQPRVGLDRAERR